MRLTIKKYNYLLIAGGLFMLLFNTSCKKYVTIPPPVNAVDEALAFADSSTATSVVLGIYSSIATGNSSNVFNAIKYGAMSADEGYYLTNASFDNFKNNTLAAGNDANVFWGAMYTKIGRANYAIEGVNASKTLSTSVKNQLVGEAKFWRAWHYFYLVNYFGDVPLVVNTDALTNGLLARAPVADVYQQIVTDLTDAKALLTTKYPSVEKARINKSAVSAFLARVYFYQQNWAAAESEASEVINSGTYSLVTNLNNVFLIGSTETIFQISLAGTSVPATVMGAEFIPASTTPSFVLYDTLANSFEANDQRKVNWTKAITYVGKTYYYPYKYKVRSTTAGTEYPVMLRLAELYLIRAEAEANESKIPQAQADLNLVRNRAGLPNTTAATKDDLVKVLERERWFELFTEFSDRWFSLKRKNRATEALSPIKPAWKPFQQLYPIPAQAMGANPNLKDNPGYF
ncbi:RagB/SusD family nutrient uptake outer membrane protein [Pinibacter soli]|uniref:RagB/SusD family nutrient uptake outer membrane protein n=1 Tax=Pinibacter soli TaxID=3044211 RepID=A0ABT6RF21_9BACT|nr:RagB/SusD family nutrient uptake outer membrane protein [Pinibacter soli]MDI3320985.1 RagB/SusD family nutrient uptake outer membrane protein [Pinibacter soli]